MRFELNNDGNPSVEKFESMLDSNEVGFFDSDEFEQIIDYYMEVGRVENARKAISLAISQHPSSVTLKLFKAELLIFDNKFELAHSLLNELHLLEPNNSEVYIQKANIYSKTENHKKAIYLLELAIEYTDDKADVYNLIGMENLFLENYVDAKVNFVKCLEFDNEDYSALYNIMYCFDFLNEQDKAIEFLTEYLETNPYCEVAWHQLGKQYFDAKEYDRALNAFDYAIISDDQFIGAYLEKGKVLEKLDRHKEAIVQYQMTLNLDDPTSFAYLRMGKCYHHLGKSDQALFNYNKCVEEDPLLDKGWLAIVTFYCERMEFQKALNFMEKALDIDPENALYWIKFAKINQSLNFFEEAEYGYRMAMELGSYELELWINRADILIGLGEYRALIVNVEHGLEFYPNHTSLLIRLGAILVKIGKVTDGVYHLQNAFKQNKDSWKDILTTYPWLMDCDELTYIQ
ncbi:MAG: tetratricopeptide repeat protein [Nonlabens sp.]